MLKVAAGIALGVLVTIGALKATPRVKTWWKERREKKVTQSETAELADEAESFDVATLAVAAFATEVEVALDEQMTNMSSADAKRRVLEIMLAAAVIADNMRALSNAQLEAGAPVELQNALEKLTAPQVTESLNRMIEADSALLGEQASADLMKIFGGGSAIEGQYVPLRNDSIRAALRLPRAV
ncbi:hypothetical protein [Kribbella sp. VKM Ac-2566]|uniref:hypothetical protein n=1 Tax=Kribbella sp. VKM Ac-2566 TaxID=2512218 RepID=UPI0010627896|nr:hypothetical protein [Kribbella sp. VKM Ac-2566]TDW98228.1 hypothetical protein EV647_2931 [Kribbella sp. VKM Ac-2566]